MYSFKGHLAEVARYYKHLSNASYKVQQDSYIK